MQMSDTSSRLLERRGLRKPPTLIEPSRFPSGRVGRGLIAAALPVLALLALGAPEGQQPAIDVGRIEDFADRDRSEGKQRTALLVAGLAGLGRIDAEAAGNLNRAYRLGLAAETGWTRMIDGAMRRRQPGTSILLTASALQALSFEDVRAVYLYHSVNALRRTGQDYLARMIAAEALART